LRNIILYFVKYTKVNVKGKVSSCLNKYHAMKTDWGVEVQFRAFFYLDTKWR